ncbi:MAG: DUF3822 family protein [Flavobacteriales bacterium]|nr:DUF3822 family protein [Flavobacteriales bacterium]
MRRWIVLAGDCAWALSTFAARPVGANNTTGRPRAHHLHQCAYERGLARTRIAFQHQRGHGLLARHQPVQRGNGLVLPRRGRMAEGLHELVGKGDSGGGRQGRRGALDGITVGGERVKLSTFGAVDAARQRRKSSMVKDPTPVIVRSASYDQDLLGLHLGIPIRPNGLGWCANEPVTGRCLMLVHGEGDELPAADLLPERPASVSFTAVPELSTLVPGARSHPAPKPRTSPWCMAICPLACCAMSPSRPWALAACTCTTRPWSTACWSASRRRVRWRCAISLVRSALEQGKQRTTLVAHRVEKRFDVALADASGLRPSNAFHAATGTDALYYILFALDQLGMAPNAVQALWAGPGWTAADLDLLRRYLPLAAPVIARGHKVLGDLDVETPEHWFALLEQAACAS